MSISNIFRAITAFSLMLFFNPLVYAQVARLERAESMVKTVVTWMQGFGVTVIIAALMYVGFRMAGGAAQWRDVAPVFWGALLVGSASAIAGALIPSMM